MFKKLPWILALGLLITLSGCCKPHTKIITGIEKVKIATEKLTPHTIELIQERILKLQKEVDNAATEEDRQFWQSELDKEIAYLKANEKLPIALEELLKALKEE